MIKRHQGFTITLEAVATIAREYGYAPQEAKFVRAYFDHGKNVLVLVMEHESFSEVPEGCCIPIDVTPRVEST